jgi:hypothetical protein
MLQKEIVANFYRNTAASLSTKLSEFQSMILTAKYKSARSFLITLEKAGAELIKRGGLDPTKLHELFIGNSTQSDAHLSKMHLMKIIFWQV